MKIEIFTAKGVFFQPDIEAYSVVGKRSVYFAVPSYLSLLRRRC